MSTTTPPVRPSAIAGYDNWPAYVQAHPRYQAEHPAAQELADALGVPGGAATPPVTVHWEETRDGITTSRLSWELGFGPRTTGWLLKPAGSFGPLPGVLALHCHGGNKFDGAERLVELPSGHPLAAASTAGHYDGRALATETARAGFAVLAHDAFAWGSRRFNLETAPWRTASALQAREALWRQDGVVPSQAERYNAAAAIHEDTIAKAAGLLGTSLAGMVAHDDLAALDILATLPGVDANRLGCIGFSGGGGRSLVLAALSPKIRSYVVTCMMTTFESLLPAYLDAHSWLLQTPGLWKLGDWPELTGRSSADSFLVQYALADQLFPEDGMWDAHRTLESLNAGSYKGSFWNAGHEFTADMQDEAIGFLAAELHAAGRESDGQELELQKTNGQHSGPPRVALVGVHGFGERHLANLARLEEAGALELVAVADPNPPAPGRLADSVAVFSTLDQLLDSGPAPDVVILATPIQTHAPLALKALRAGADVYVEKPPVASMAQFREVHDAAADAGKLVQVGFQSLGSEALPAIADVVTRGGIGDVLGLSAKGQWVRTTGYFKRSAWAGRRSLNGVDVVDGVATNALAHAIATALHLAGARTIDDVASVETDLYRAHPTESDDTSVIRVRTAAGRTLLCALTLCAPEQQKPTVTLHGTQGEITLLYTEDEVVITTPDGERRESFGRRDLLENLVEARSSGTPLLSSLADSGAFTSVLEAIRTAPEPQQIPAEHLIWEGAGDDAHPVIHGITALIDRAAKAQATFAELGVPWARSLPPVHTLAIDSQPVAEYRDGSHIRATSSPRPYLHPVRTLAGTVVTDHQPLDHVWHLGVGVALQDVDGVNFWGGRTYTREAGQYVWRPDHGSISRIAGNLDAHPGGPDQPGRKELPADESGRLHETLCWNGPDGGAILFEDRTWKWAAVDPSTWRLTLDFALTPAGSKPVSLGSPGSNGRHQGGYGGFFWRLPASEGAHVWTPVGSGEEQVHGSVTPWLAWSGKFASETFDGADSPGNATLVFVAAEGCTDPWFVRLAGYPGVGQSLAWDAPVIAEPGSPVRRSVTVLVADGILGSADIEELINQQKGHP